ncbi:uncharacterized protein LAJ45_05056 [Morchella importuna]|uniref:uncharacterized protein n=1 Tax=Morchella importuna TaxID=1174673 RepID=UPI001E8E9529|nr:uncharacterized protein LAJ45_05056 [Morchella importuna]KAH8150874.1 hypothetical protein LAJ45_05056 [Morchella importuna]
MGKQKKDSAVGTKTIFGRMEMIPRKVFFLSEVIFRDHPYIELSALQVSYQDLSTPGRRQPSIQAIYRHQRIDTKLFGGAYTRFDTQRSGFDGWQAHGCILSWTIRKQLLYKQKAHLNGSNGSWRRRMIYFKEARYNPAKRL